MVSELVVVSYKEFPPQNKTKKNKHKNQQKITQVLLECLPKILIIQYFKTKTTTKLIRGKETLHSFIFSHKTHVLSSQYVAGPARRVGIKW